MTHTRVVLVRHGDSSALPHLCFATDLVNSHGLEDQNGHHQWVTELGPILGSSCIFSLVHMNVA